MSKSVILDDLVYRRLVSVSADLASARGHDVDISEAINHLIDVYQDSLTLSGEHGGG